MTRTIEKISELLECRWNDSESDTQMVRSILNSLIPIAISDLKEANCEIAKARANVHLPTTGVTAPDKPGAQIDALTKRLNRLESRFQSFLNLHETVKDFDYDS